MTYVNYSKVFETFVSFEDLTEAWRYLGLLTRVLEIRPELFKAIQLTFIEITQCLFLELFVEVGPEATLQAVTVESEEALKAISRQKVSCKN